MPVTAAVMKKFEGVLFAEGGELALYHGKVKKAVTGDKLKQFGSLSRVEEQTKFVLGLPGVEGPQLEASTSIRNLEKAKEFKETGNDFFRRNMFQDAFKNYTLAIQHCPVNEAAPEDPGNKDYSIMFANRSAAFDKSGLYEACIHDIDRALKFGYPRQLWYKIYKRKGHACIKMRQYIVARAALEVSLKNIGKSDIPKEKDRDKYRNSVRKQMTVFNVTKNLYNCELAERPPHGLAEGALEDRGISSKIKMQEDGAKKALVVTKDVDVSDNLVSLDPYVAVVNVSGGRAGGKICPHTLEKMFHPVPCSLGSLQTFSTFEARDEANRGYHKHEWSILAALERVGLLERGRLALRIVTQIEPDQVEKVLSCLSSPGGQSVPQQLEAAVKTLQLPVDMASPEERLAATSLALFLARCLHAAGYTVAKAGSHQEAVLALLHRAVLVALHHTRENTLFDIPKDKKDYMDAEVKSDTCAFAIYPDLLEIEEAGTGPEACVFPWFLEKKLVLTSFRRVEAGARLCLVEEKGEAVARTQPNDMITFRCANELCSVSFPLKENTKEKIISCPLDDCGLKTNIWERLKLIQKLKKDFGSAKEEFLKGDVSLAKDIIEPTIQEWDRIIVRPYREVDQLQALLLKCLKCEVADQERRVVEGNQMGMLVPIKNKANLYPKDPEMEGMTSKTFEIK